MRKNSLYYKKYIKSLILEKVSDVQFSRPNSCRKAEIICSEAICEEAIDQCMNASYAHNGTLLLRY